MTELELQTRLTAYLAAEGAILGGAQEYTIGQGSTARRVVRADLEQIRAGIKETRADLLALQNLASGTRRLRYVRPFN
jgi:hypothetical protein